MFSVQSEEVVWIPYHTNKRKVRSIWSNLRGAGTKSANYTERSISLNKTRASPRVPKTTTAIAWYGALERTHHRTRASGQATRAEEPKTDDRMVNVIAAGRPPVPSRTCATRTPSIERNDRGLRVAWRRAELASCHVGCAWNGARRPSDLSAHVVVAAGFVTHGRVVLA